METSNRLISVHIIEILNAYATKNKRMEQAEIMRHLEEDYGETISRHTCSDYLKTLRTYGYIQGSRGVFLNSLFTLEEVRLLIDGIMYGGHLEKEDAMALIDKLRKMQGGCMDEVLNHTIYVSSCGKTDNSHIHRIQDIVDEAISGNRKLRIELDRADDPGVSYVVDPYAVFPDHGQYRLLCATEQDGVVSCGLNRIRTAEILAEPLVPLDASFSFEDFLKAGKGM